MSSAMIKEILIKKTRNMGEGNLLDEKARDGVETGENDAGETTK